MGATHLLFHNQGRGRPIGDVWVTPNDIPADQAAALKWLYDNTDGANWTDNTNWGKTKTANDWFGVTVAGGVVTSLAVNSNNLVGNISSWAVSDLSSMATLVIRSNPSLTGDISGWTVIAAMRFFHIYSTQLSGSPIMTSAAAIDQFYYHSCGLAEADVDAVCLAIATRFSAGGFTDAAPALNIGGTNAAPSGVYADEDPPITGLGAVFEICTDPEGTGFNTWTATVTGSGPYP